MDGQPADALDMCLTDDGESAFYAAHRGQAPGPVFIPGQELERRKYPQPPAFMMHHSPNTLATQPAPLWTQMSPEDPSSMAAAQPRSAGKTSLPVDVQGVPKMSPPDCHSLAGSLDSLEDVTFEVDVSSSLERGSSNMGDLGNGDVFVLEDDTGFKMELSAASRRDQHGQLEVEVWVSESMTVSDYEQFMCGDGDAIDFDEEDVAMLQDMQADDHPHHGADCDGSLSSVRLSSFEPMVKQRLAPSGASLEG